MREVFVFGEAPGSDAFVQLLLLGDGDPPDVPIDPREDLVVAALLERHDRPAEGRDADAPQPGRQHACRHAAVLALGEDDTMLGVLPFFHIYGMIVIMNLGLLPRRHDRHHAALRSRAVPHDLEKYRVTFANVVPPIVLALAKHPLVEQIRSEPPAHRVLRRRAARRGPGRWPPARASGCAGHPGLRPDRDVASDAMPRA